MERIWRQMIVLLISAGFICTAILVFSSGTAKAQDDYTFGSENVNKGTSTNPTGKNTEDGTFETLFEADQYPNTNFSGTTETITVGTGGQAAFPGSLDTDDASRRSYTEANTAANTITIIRPTADSSVNWDTVYPASPTTHWSKVSETTTGSDSDTTYVTTATTTDRDVFTIGDISPTGTPSIDIRAWVIAKKGSGGSMNLQFGIVSGGTDYSAYSGTLTTGYLNYSKGWLVDPKTSSEWTSTTVNALTTYMTTSDVTPVPYVTQIGIVVWCNYTVQYNLDVSVEYASVTSTGQTISYAAFCQGYRSNSENFNVYAYNYTSLGWDSKTTIQAASDTDYNFNLNSYERDSGNNKVKFRIVDGTANDVTQDIVYFDVLKVTRIEKGYSLDVDMTSTTVAQYGNITLRIKGYTSAEQFNVNVWNYTSSAYDNGLLAITSLSNIWQTTINLNDVNHRSGTSVKIQFVDATAAASDQVLDSLYLDVVWVTRYHTNPSLSQNGCDPAIANLGSTIHFWAVYTDYDNEAPSAGYPKVHIDSSDYTLVENETDTSYWDGKNFHYDKSDLTSGSHDYYFIAKDANSPEVTTGTKQVSIHVSPTLTQDGVTPLTGNNGDQFTFFVTYSDADSDAASYVKVHIDSTDYDMTYNGTGGGYHYDKSMSGGAHTYYYKTKDAYSSEVTTTTKDLDVNNPPILNSYGRLPADPVYPTIELNFTCTYTDIDNDPPTAIKWRENGGAIQNVTMSAVDAGDSDYTDGKAFYVLRTLSHGIHGYDFFANDGTKGVSGGSNSVTVQNRAPTIDNKFVDDHEWRNTYWEYDYAYTDLDGDTVVFEMSTNATFLNINSASGLVYGTTSDPVGWYSATVWCNDSYSGSDSDSFILYVDNRAPVITNGPNAHIDQWRNQVWYYDFDYSDADGDSMTWERSGPAWLTIASDGNLSGTTSDTPGLYSFVIYANDSYGGSDNYAFDIHITNRDPVITNGPGSSVNEWRNTVWQYDFDYSDADGDSVSWGRSGIDWLGINSNGLLSGTTTNMPEDYEITVYCNDSYSGQDTYVFTLHILNRMPTITNGPGSHVDQWRNQAWYYNFDFSDPDGDSVSWERSGPAWLTVASDGNLSGTTSDTPGLYTFTIYANDSYGGSDDYTFDIHIANRAPVITSAGNTTQQLNTYMAYLVTATDSDSDSLSLDMWTNATWLSKDGFWINGTATPLGWYQVNVWVNDSYGGSDSDGWQVTVWVTSGEPPSFTSAPIDLVDHPVDYYYDCNASDPEFDPLTFDLTSTHPNLIIDPDTGEVTGYIATAGTWDVNISVTDGSYIVWQNFSLTATNTVPYFTSSPIENVDHPVDYYYDSNASDADGDSLVFDIQTSCEYIDINPTTGIVSGHIPIAGTWAVNISVSDPDSTAWQNFTLTASNDAPSFTSSPIEDWQHGMEYVYDANGSDPNSDPLIFDIDGNCTAFLSIIPSTGVISGILPTVGWWYVNVSLTDSWITVWQNYTVTGLNTAPSFTSSGITEWQHGTMYYYDANANDVNSDVLSWHLEGNCTTYLEINSTSGVVNGTLPIMGYWLVNISASDSWSTVWQNFTVFTLNAAPYFTTSPVLTGTNGTAYYYDANVHDNNSDAITFALIDSPGWLFVDEDTGEVEGTCTLPDDYAVHLRIFDGFVYRWQNWTLTISEPAPPGSPDAPSNMPCLTTLIMIGAVGFGALIVFRRVTDHDKPAKKPEPNSDKKETKK